MNNQNIFKLISRLLIAFGVLVINLVVFRELGKIICLKIYHVNVFYYITSGNFDEVTSSQIAAIRLFFTISSIGTFLFTAFIVPLILRQKPTKYLRLNIFPKPFYLMIIPVLLITAMPFLSWLVEVNGRLEFPGFLSKLEKILQTMEDLNNNLYKLMLSMNGYPDLFINIFVMALIPAVGEELFCRGVLLNVVYDYSGKFLRSVVVVALIFTLFHMQFYKFMPMMVLAVILGLFINWTQSIWASILFHFLNNTTAVIGNFYYQRGVKNLLTEEHAQMPLVLTILSFLLTIAIIIWVNKYSKQNTILINE